PHRRQTWDQRLRLAHSDRPAVRQGRQAVHLAAGGVLAAAKVHSSVVPLVIDPQCAALGVDRACFFDFLRLALGAEPEHLVNNLKQQYDGAAVRAALRSTRLREDVRAEAVPLDKAATLFRSLQPIARA